MNDRLSIITPTYNSESVIEKSIFSVVSQTYNNFEHIIVDNQSTDKTLDIVTKIYSEYDLLDHLKIITEEDDGIADAINKGIRISHGKIINILHSDDHFMQNTIFEQVVEKFRLKNNLLFVHGNIFFHDSKYGSIVKYPICRSVKKGIPYFHQTIFIKKVAFDNIGYFNTKYRIAMDYEFYCRLENEIPNLQKQIFYLNGHPIVWVEYGGISSTKPLEGLSEVKRALRENNLLTFKSLYMVWKNIFKTMLKDLFILFKMKAVLVALRNFKWRRLNH